MSVQLSQHFWLHEFLRSQTAARLGRPIEAPPEIVTRLRWLCLTVLDPIRIFVNTPITVNSGYRPLWLNELVGGSPRSQHMHGEAADIVAVGLSPLQLCEAIVASNVPFHQNILEFGQWTHVSCGPLGQTPRHEVLTYQRIANESRVMSGLVA